MRVWQRYDYLYTTYGPRIFEIWISDDANAADGILEDWELVGTYAIVKAATDAEAMQEAIDGHEFWIYPHDVDFTRQFQYYTLQVRRKKCTSNSAPATKKGWLNANLFVCLYILSLSLKCNAYTAYFAAQWGRKLRHGALHLHNLLEALLDGAYDVLSHALNGALSDLHLLANNLIYCKVVHSLLHSIFVGYAAEVSGDEQFDIEAVAHLLLQIVAAVVGTKLHILQSDSVKHSSAGITQQ